MSFGSFLNKNNNPVVQGVNQGMQQTTPRLNLMNAYNSRPTNNYPILAQQQNNTNATAGINNLVNGGLSLINGIGAINKGSESQNDDDVLSNIGDIAGLYSNLSSDGAGGAGGYGGLISGGINGLTSFAKSGDYKDGLQGTFGVNKDGQSEIMQALNGTKNGAMMGSTFGPIGAVVGGVLGLGSSFLDDI